MEYLEAGGARIPKLGLGTWQNTGQSCTESVQTALELGYRHIDTAQEYGNEAAVGEAIAAADVDRDEIFVTTKVKRSNLRREDVLESVSKSLDRLGLETVDLLLVHWPHPRVPAEETLRAMAELREDRLVEHLGVSNFTRAQFEAAREAVDAPIVTNQVLYHPYKDQSGLRDYAVATGSSLTAYSPLARGGVLSDSVLGELGDSYEKSPAQVALRWLVQQDGVIAIPKASSREHIEANLDIFDFELGEQEMQRIHAHRGSLKLRLRAKLPSLVRRIPV